jgi:hypothetical protein
MSKFTKTIAGFAGSIALIASLAGSVSAASFSVNLTMRSKGADVSALQSWLIGQGYSIPAGATGYFGGQTKTALAAYQTAKGISPAVGYFGPITRAAVNAGGSMGSTSSVPGCAAGAMFSSTSGASCAGSMASIPGCGAGAMFSSTTGASCSAGSSTSGSTGSFVMDGTDGSLTLTYAPVVSSGLTVKKGETKAFIGVKLSATSGNVNVNRFDVHFDVRPWLFFSQLVLKDDAGNVIATKNLNNDPNSATEVTVGSDYLVRFDNVNAAVKPVTDRTLVVSGTVLSATDKIATNGTTVHISVPTGSVRTINGKGYTDSLGIAALSQGGDLSGGTAQALLLGGSTSVGDILLRVDPSTPATRIVPISNSNITQSVTLGTFSLKSQNNSSTINQLNLDLYMTGAKASSLQNFRLVAGSQTYGANTVTAVAANASTTFTNLTIPLAQDTWVPVSLVADVAATTTVSSFTAQAALKTVTTNSISSNPVGTDANFNSVTENGGTSQTATANVNTFLQSGIAVSGSFAPIGQPIYSYGTNSGASGYNMSAALTLTNNGNTDVYISQNASIALATSTSPANIASSTLSIVSVGSTPAGDVAGVSYIISAGQSRTFTYTGALQKNGSATGPEKFSITGIRFGTVGTTDGTAAAGTANTVTVASSNASNIITFGLESLNTTGSF